VENKRSARRYLKQLSREFVIDDYEWFSMHDGDATAITAFRERLLQGKIIGIMSEAGCPGIADPGQALIAIAQELEATVKPLVGPSSILLALMASGMNGQRFQFLGYLPVKEPERSKAIREIESESQKKDCTQIFIETPYRNKQLIETLMKTCQASTKLCLAANLTGDKEWIKTKTIKQWKEKVPDLNKVPVIYCLIKS
jgi:16S rRNA (cytidine1402-2'-O)-methyltransferase